MLTSHLITCLLLIFIRSTKAVSTAPKTKHSHGHTAVIRWAHVVTEVFCVHIRASRTATYNMADTRDVTLKKKKIIKKRKRNEQFQGEQIWWNRLFFGFQSHVVLLVAALLGKL